MRLRLLTAGSLLALALGGCATGPQSAPPPARPATIVGSEEKSMLLDNFTAFVAAVDGQPVAAERQGWNTPIELKPGRHVLAVAFKRGAFSAGTQLELSATADARYQLNHATDAQLFGKNSYCEFWITDLATGRPVTGRKQAAVTKAN